MPTEHRTPSNCSYRSRDIGAKLTTTAGVRYKGVPTQRVKTSCVGVQSSVELSSCIMLN